MFRMFPVTTNTTVNDPNWRVARGAARNAPVSNNSLQFTSKVSSIFQIYSTKTYSCGSCGSK